MQSDRSLARGPQVPGGSLHVQSRHRSFLETQVDWTNPSLAFENLVDYLHNNGFYLQNKQKSIHSQESVNFTSKFLLTDSWYNLVASNGLSFEFIRKPDKYQEPNNLSAIRHADYLKTKIVEWEAKGFVKQVPVKPHCISPLSVAEKLDDSGKLKLRPVLDLSRHVNLFFREEHCKMDDLSVSEVHITKDCYQAAFDLESQFFHVQINKEQQTYFGFCINDENNTEVYYVFQVLPFGAKPAVRIVTRLLKPVLSFAHSIGICLNIFVDDGRVIGQEKDETLYKLKAVLLIVQLAGWNIQWEKTSTEPSQTLTHQGFITDSRSMQYFCPTQKLEKIRLSIADFIDKCKKSEQIPAKEFASILGKIISLKRSHGNIVLISTRASQHALGVQVNNSGWNSDVQLNYIIGEEFSFCYII